MSFAKVYSAQINFLKANILNIEIDVSIGLHSFSIIGLPDKSIDESKDRVSSAIKNSGFVSPRSLNKKIVVSLSPADIKKEGTFFDLAIAVCFLLADKQISFDPRDKIFLGELGLDGKIFSIKGALPLVEEARRKGFKQVFLPEENISQVIFVKDIKIFGVKSLADVANHLLGLKILAQSKQKTMIQDYLSTENKNDFAKIKGQQSIKRALEISATGKHNIAMYGPPGVGKTMLANAFLSILPDLEYEEIFEVTSIHSAVGLNKNNLIFHPPFRSPHHTSSYTSIVGGGTNPKPGEITLAHKGVLFLDEFPEFDRRVIEALRQPLESKEITITRANASIIFPADFILIVSMNPCPCGYASLKEDLCKCTAVDLYKYKRKLSGPIVDRIDMWVSVGQVDFNILNKTEKTETSVEIKKRVIAGRKMGEKIQSSIKQNLTTPIDTSIKNIGEIDTNFFDAYSISQESRELFIQSIEKMSLSMRAYKKILKVARTIADLDQSAIIQNKHILEALQYRPKPM
ncbi:MAG: YifB family Mg chelatase-like AAA ATPase [Candidatus Pacebacteria bacterium]|nr:YifB family Mg chelatase-like AAA ATPase [Candidatus Paceibacterota bacterium]MCF7862675.1 YifB family Mg chelatase-like AAA ATPase [Candidatus Paceibacterota bacterium]